MNPHGQEHHGPYLSVVIPAFNEEERIGSTLKQVCEYLSRQSYTWEIVLVDDGSKDQTVAVARTIMTGQPLRIVTHERNQGKGAAIKHGIVAAQGELRLFSDADLSTPIDELSRLLQPLGEGYDIAIGSRGLKESRLERRQAWYRELMGRVFNLLVRLLVLGGIKDTQCGFKLFTAQAAQALFPLQTMQGYAFDVEILLRARQKGYKIKEVPVRWINSPASKIHPLLDSARMLLDLVKLRLGLLPQPPRNS
jgi:dolichyl-phosphate beta-glucosyltransferase